MVAFCSLALIPVQVQASLVDSRLASGESLSQRASQIESIGKALEHEIVRQRLADFGLSPQEISDKLQTLSDAQLQQLASLSDDLAAGNGLGVVIAILVIVILVIVILKLYDREIITK
jgi:hypothetical protein